MSNRSATRVLVVSGAFPSNADPSRGIFVYQRVHALAQLPGLEVRVIAPTPWAPPLRFIPKFDHYAKLPKSEIFGGLAVYRPRYPLPPKIGGYFHPQLMYPSLMRSVRRIRREFPFDLIDSHFVYAAGVAATKVAKALDVPVCLTGRGEDMMRFPSMPFKGERIRWALNHADAFVGVSKQISQEMVRHGACAERVTTIANGVDTETFRPIPMRECRQRLGLPQDRQILMTVGDRLELKGFHVVIEALPSILRKHPEAMYVCVGGPGRHGRDYTSQIEAMIKRHGLEDRVVLAGAQDHADLPYWYNAADLYVLASSREGSPNVLLEALACGVPAVATRVGGATDELDSPEVGILMKERTIEDASESIKEALSKRWDRNLIREKMSCRSWKHTAEAAWKHLRQLLIEQNREDSKLPSDSVKEMGVRNVFS